MLPDTTMLLLWAAGLLVLALALVLAGAAVKKLKRPLLAAGFAAAACGIGVAVLAGVLLVGPQVGWF